MLSKLAGSMQTPSEIAADIFSLGGSMLQARGQGVVRGDHDASGECHSLAGGNATLPMPPADCHLYPQGLMLLWLVCAPAGWDHQLPRDAALVRDDENVTRQAALIG